MHSIFFHSFIMCSTNERPPTHMPGTQHTKINEGRYFQRGFINVGKSWRESGQRSIIIFSREETESLTNEMEMERITCPVLVSTHPVHHLIQIRFSQSGFCSTRKYNFQCLEYKLLRGRWYISLLFLSLPLNQKVFNRCLRKITSQRLFSNAIEPLQCHDCLSISHTRLPIACPPRPVSVSLASTPSFIRW